jgi:hypothetical protein
MPPKKKPPPRKRSIKIMVDELEKKVSKQIKPKINLIKTKPKITKPKSQLELLLDEMDEEEKLKKLKKELPPKKKKVGRPPVFTTTFVKWSPSQSNIIAGMNRQNNSTFGLNVIQEIETGGQFFLTDGVFLYDINNYEKIRFLSEREKKKYKPPPKKQNKTKKIIFS